jgi:hypothetical protein
MLIDLLSTANYISFNIKVAEIVGLHAAIYISELMNINDKAIRKNKTEENCFNVDREYLCKRTTLPQEEQIEIEKTLIKIGILTKPKTDTNCICLNINVLTSLLVSNDEKLYGDIKQLSKSKKQTKADKIRQALKDNIITTNEELKQAYDEWIDAVYAKQGWMSTKSVSVAQRTIDEYSNRDLDVALKIIEIATINGYRDMEWAINKYKTDYKNNYLTTNPIVQKPVIQKALKLSEEVF